MTPVDWRESLALSREEGTPFPVAWEIATTEHPLEDFMEGCFNEGRDSEGKDFAVWLEQIWAKAYNGLSPSKKPTRLEPSGMPSKGVSVAYNGSEGAQVGVLRTGTDATVHDDPNPERASVGPSLTPASPSVRRCKSGDRCDRVGGHGVTGLFCEHHAGELGRIRKVHGLDEAFDWDEFSSKTYQAAFG